MGNLRMSSKKLLAIDIGNTNITLGIFKGKRLIKKAKLPTHTYSLYEKNIKKLIKGPRAKDTSAYRVIISSVVPIALCRLISTLNKMAKCDITILGKDIKVPIANRYRIKEEVGQDRLVNAFGAKAIYGAPSVVIDFGTAVTFDIVSKKGEYLGGLIMPGIGISLSSLYEKTALLPKVRLKYTADMIGKDTRSSMRGGILFGFGAMCDGLVSRYKKLLGKGTRVIATGGNAKLVKKYTKSIDIVYENLTLKGLQLIANNLG